MSVCGLQAGRPRFNETLARKLAVEDVLQGHDGCVNRLAWNEEGNYLASGSDDRRVCAPHLLLVFQTPSASSQPAPSLPPGTPVHVQSRRDMLRRASRGAPSRPSQVLLWSYPDSGAPPVTVRTPHHANIFGVRFLPASDNRRLVTGAMDCCVQLHVLDAPPAAHKRARAKVRQRPTVRWVPDEGADAIASHTTKFLCHTKRVKVCRRDHAPPWTAGRGPPVHTHVCCCMLHWGFQYVLLRSILALLRRACWSANPPVEMAGNSAWLHVGQGVEVAPRDPNMFWSVAEDGDVRQFDTRCRFASCNHWDEPSCAVVCLTSTGSAPCSKILVQAASCL